MNAQPALFLEDVCAGRRPGYPESRDAFDAPPVTNLQRRILAYFAARASGTVKTVIRDLELSRQTSSAQLYELMRAGLVEPTGTRRDRCSVRKITDLGRRALSAMERAA